MLTIGKVYKHPTKGPVYITSGAFEVGGRVSNHWHFRKVKRDGSLGEDDGDYGGDWKEIPASMRIKIPARYFLNKRKKTKVRAPIPDSSK